MFENKQLFDFMLRRIHEVGNVNGLKSPQAFGRWFAEMYFKNPHDIFISDGSGDAKIDLFFNSTNGQNTEHYVVNTKYTEKYNSLAPVAFYNEINAFWQAFANEGNRETYPSSIVREELRPRYKKLFNIMTKDRHSYSSSLTADETTLRCRQLSRAQSKSFTWKTYCSSWWTTLKTRCRTPLNYY